MLVTHDTLKDARLLQASAVLALSTMKDWHAAQGAPLKTSFMDCWNTAFEVLTGWKGQNVDDIADALALAVLRRLGFVVAPGTLQPAQGHLP